MEPVVAVAVLHRTHVAQGWATQGEKPDGDWRRAQFTQGQAGQRKGGKPGGDWRRAQLAQGVIPGLPLRGRDGEHGGQRGPAGGYYVSHRAAGNRVATSSVRPTVVANGLPERGEPAAPLLMFDSYTAGVETQPERVVVSSRRVKFAKQVEPLRQLRPDG